MVKPRRDRTRERRITMEIVVDAYDTHERAMGWYYYLQEQLNFPFTATCTAKRAISPLRPKDEVQVIGMPSEDDCEHEMFVTIRWEKDGLAVPLAQLRPIKATYTQTKQVLALLGQNGLRALTEASLTPACRRRRARRASLGEGLPAPAAPDADR